MSLPRGSRPRRSLRGRPQLASRQGRLPGRGAGGEGVVYTEAVPHSNCVPSAHIASIMTASLRATAT